MKVVLTNKIIEIMDSVCFPKSKNKITNNFVLSINLITFRLEIYKKFNKLTNRL